MDASPYRIDTETWQRLLTELGVDARSSAPRAASPRHARRASSEDSDDDTPREPWAIALRRAGRLGRALGDGRWAVLCPQDERHTNPDGSAEAAVGSCVLLPAGEGRLFGRPHCSHAHCAGLTLADWIHGVGAVVYADSIAEARGWRVARGYVMTPWGVFEARRKPLALPKVDAPDAAEPALAADAPAEGGELGAVVAAEEPFQWAPGEPLCNFAARLTLDVEEHAPEETRRAFELSCTVGGAPQVIRIPAEEFPSMGWVPKRLGGEAVIEAGRDTKDRLRAAIQHLSMPIPKKAVFTCTGWRTIAGREVYLSSTGGLGADGAVPGVEVQLAAPLRAFALPPPIEGTALGTALERAAELFLLSASGPAVALFGAVWRAPLGYSPLVVYLSGAPEAGKTYLAAIAQSFYGQGWSEKRLPASLKHATAAALNELRALARDCVFVVDDFVVTGTSEDLKAAEKITLVARAQHGQHSARQGLTTAGRIDGGNDSVSSIPIITGETLPRGHSLRSRLLVTELHRPVPESELLRAAARAGASGVFAGLMAAFLRWLAPRLPAARAELGDRTARVVDKLSDGGKDHRALALLGEVGVGVGWFLEFATAHGLRAELVTRVRDTAWRTLRELVEAQRASKAEQDPAKRFVALVGDVLRSKRSHLTRPDGTPPVDPHLWGWTVRAPIEPRRGDQEPIEQPPTPNGRCVGFIEGDFVWLYPEATLAEVQILARDNLDPLALAERDLGRRLYEGGLLAKHEVENAQKSYLHRKKFRGRVLSGYCLKAEALDGSGAGVGAAVLEGRNGVGADDTGKPN